MLRLRTHIFACTVGSNPTPQRRCYIWGMAERVGFEPTVGLHLRRISSAVHSTTLPPLRIQGLRQAAGSAADTRPWVVRRRVPTHRIRNSQAFYRHLWDFYSLSLARDGFFTAEHGLNAAMQWRRREAWLSGVSHSQTGRNAHKFNQTRNSVLCKMAS